MLDWTGNYYHQAKLSKGFHIEIKFICVDLYSTSQQGCISCVTCSYPELTEDHVLTSAYVKIFRIVTRNAVNKSF